MLRKSISLATMLLAAVLMFAQQPAGRADNLYINVMTNNAKGNYELFVYGGGSGNATAADGWTSICLADGNWIDGYFLGLSVATNGAVTTHIYGFYDDYLPCDCVLSVSANHSSVSLSVNGSPVARNSSVVWGDISASK